MFSVIVQSMNIVEYCKSIYIRALNIAIHIISRIQVRLGQSIILLYLIQMSDVFDNCQKNFLHSIRLVQKRLEQSQAKLQKIQEVYSALEDANRQLIGMDLQYKACKNSTMSTKIKIYKDQLCAYKRKVKQRQEVVQNEQSCDSHVYDSQDQAAVDPLVQAKRMMYQSEAVSNQVAVGIQDNNQKLINNITRLQNINNQLAAAKQLLGSIQQKLSKNKYTLWGILTVLFLVLTFVFYTYSV